MKKINYRKMAIVLVVASTILTFLISYITLEEYNIFSFVLTFIVLAISLFCLMIIFLLTKENWNVKYYYNCF